MLVRLIDPILTTLVRFLVFLLAILPKWLADGLAKLLVRGIVGALPRFRHAALRNLEIVFPDLPAAERRAIYKRSIDVLARNLLMFARIPTFNPSDFEQMFDYSEPHQVMKEMRDKAGGKGLLFLAMHFGSFELMAQAHAVLDQPCAILARDFGLPMLDRFWRARREHFGSRLFSRAGGFRELMSALGAGENVAVLFDQNVKANHAAFVSLFGIAAATTKAVGIAALRSGSPAVVTCCVEVSPWKFRMHAEQIPNPSEFEGTADEQVLQFLEAAHRVVEKFIRAYPEQWFWIHRRFKTRPPGEAENYYK